ncbi:hypothetical protein PK69_08340 [Xanthomonas phaseoli pv. phaseoli]|nr:MULTISPECIES: VCBS repeat-containing protein [Xanthomonas]ATS23871.1 VCBS repeat-containing protein [Xanthomonas phaseoli pv. phaseoli]ATS28352.1 VCBS repeat-containing protein [Xanthomonas phaseoli pv. phaseoli]ATS32337.1 VCBS repeat-containing protein [Xanthomonas phaseoli pv. phaseoli]ATS36538.1 VCBS repeat-containing protein [Xanthomonas phaseoli pv. phaseoli]AZU12952.1 hypothetical protein AC609_09575 [Xanthomonas phaseoli pv. phaseoli]
MTATFATPAGAATLPAGAATLLPAGQSVMSVASADFTGDGRLDYVVALRASAEHVLRGHGDAAPPRTLLVLVANADGGFVEAARNTRVIFRADEGGQCDPFLDSDQGLVAKGAYFTVQNGVACGQHWTDYITFRYDRRRGVFVFHKRVIEAWEMNTQDTPDAEALRLRKHKEIAADPRQPVLLSAYTPGP